MSSREYTARRGPTMDAIRPVLLATMLVFQASPLHSQIKTTVPKQIPASGTNGYGIPACLYCPQPQYTQKAAQTKSNGPVLLDAVITFDGHATNISITKSSGQALDRKAIETV